MTFRGSFERDMKEFAESRSGPAGGGRSRGRRRHRNHPAGAVLPPAGDVLLARQAHHLLRRPAPTPAFVYNALGKRPLPTKDKIVADTVDSIAARFNLRYSEQKWLNATAELVSEDSQALAEFLAGAISGCLVAASSAPLGGMDALARFHEREQVFEALRQSSLVQCIANGRAEQAS